MMWSSDNVCMCVSLIQSSDTEIKFNMFEQRSFQMIFPYFTFMINVRDILNQKPDIYPQLTRDNKFVFAVMFNIVDLQYVCGLTS